MGPVLLRKPLQRCIERGVSFALVLAVRHGLDLRGRSMYLLLLRGRISPSLRLWLWLP